MKCIAAPMVGGLVTSAFLTLEIIPVIYTYWRGEQLLWRRLDETDAPTLAWLRRHIALLKIASTVFVAVIAARLYLSGFNRWFNVVSFAALITMLVTIGGYLLRRYRVRHLIAFKHNNPS